MVDRAFLEPLVREASRDVSVGLCGGKIYRLGSDRVFDSAGGRVDLWFGRAYGWGRGDVDRGQFERVRSVDYLGGSCVLVPRRVVERIGLLPTGYFMYYEETDYATAARRAGFRNLYVPDSVIWHEAAHLNAAPDPTRLYWAFRAQVLFVRRYGSPLQRAVFFLYRMGLFLPAYALHLVLRNPRAARSFVRGLVAGWRAARPAAPD